MPSPCFRVTAYIILSAIPFDLPVFLHVNLDLEMFFFPQISVAK